MKLLLQTCFNFDLELAEVFATFNPHSVISYDSANRLQRGIGALSVQKFGKILNFSDPF
jgi:hypothetical protein